MTAPAEPAETGAADTASRQETEWQLSARDLSQVRQWLRDHNAVDGFIIEARPTRTIFDTYLDTEDWRIHRAGFALRLRDVPGGAEATLKDLDPAVNGVRTRREFNEPLASAEDDILTAADGPVSARVHAVAGPQPLKTLFRVRTQRQCFAVLKPEGEEAAEIALDDTIVVSPDGASKARLKRVEVEALSDTPASLEGLVDQLRTECALEPAIDSKYEVGLKSTGLESPGASDFGSTRIEPTLSIGEVARANLRRHLGSWLAREPAARLGEDVEQLHELRIAARRIDTTLKIFEDFLPRSFGRQRPAWKVLVRSLGGVRDLDVQLAELAHFARELNESNAQQLEPLRNRLEAERRVARTRMLSALDRASTRRLIERMRYALASPDVVPVRRNNPAAALVAPKVIRRTFRKVRQAAREARANPSPASHHFLRRRAKRLRYAIESFEGFYGKSADDLLQAVRRLQRSLGAHQDAHVAANRFKAMVGARGYRLPPETLFLMGVFAERQRIAAGDARRRFPKGYGRVRRRRWRALRRAMDELRAAQAVGGRAPSPPTPNVSAS
jgi:CHAD domain-containing protein